MRRSSSWVGACGILFFATGAFAATPAKGAAVRPPRLATRAATCPVTPLACNQTVSGSLATTDCQEPANGGGFFYDDFYQVNLAAGQEIAVSLSSASVDTYLLVEDANSQVIAQDDDGGGGTNSQVAFTAPATGTYFVIASSAIAGETGPYSLTLSCSAAGASTCNGTTTTLCLGGNRFEVTATYQSPGQSGVAQVVRLTDDTGYLWFFNAANVETVLKVLDGCALGNHYWFFAGGLTNVYTQIKVTDTSTGFTRLYTNPLNQPFEPIQDTSAFPDCP